MVRGRGCSQPCMLLAALSRQAGAVRLPCRKKMLAAGATWCAAPRCLRRALQRVQSPPFQTVQTLVRKTRLVADNLTSLLLRQGARAEEPEPCLAFPLPAPAPRRRAQAPLCPGLRALSPRPSSCSEGWQHCWENTDCAGRRGLQKVCGVALEVEVFNADTSADPIYYYGNRPARQFTFIAWGGL